MYQTSSRASTRKGSVSRETTPSEAGSFLLRFVPEGIYSLLVFEDDTGWCIQTGLVVRGACDAGALALRPGSRLTARLLGDWTPLRSRHEYRVELRHVSTGIERNQDPDSEENGGTVLFDNLWPGEWRVRLIEGDRTLFSTNCMLNGAKLVTVDLAWSDETMSAQTERAERPE